MEEGKVIGIHLARLESLICGIIREELTHFEGKVQNLYLQQDSLMLVPHPSTVFQDKLAANKISPVGNNNIPYL